jgi:hypothetical protein
MQVFIEGEKHKNCIDWFHRITTVLWLIDHTFEGFQT